MSGVRICEATACSLKEHSIFKSQPFRCPVVISIACRYSPTMLVVRASRALRRAHLHSSRPVEANGLERPCNPWMGSNRLEADMLGCQEAVDLLRVDFPARDGKWPPLHGIRGELGNAGQSVCPRPGNCACPCLDSCSWRASLLLRPSGGCTESPTLDTMSPWLARCVCLQVLQQQRTARQ